MIEKKKTLNVTIQTKEVIFAVMNKTHVTARSMKAANKLNYEASAHMQASEDSENAFELLRAVSNALCEVKVEMGEYLKESLSDTNNLIKKAVENEEEVKYVFELPSNYNPASGDALGAGIHEFVVHRACYEWYRMTCPEIADSCRVDSESALERTKKALYQRERPIRPTYETEPETPEGKDEEVIGG